MSLINSLAQSPTSSHSFLVQGQLLDPYARQCFNVHHRDCKFGTEMFPLSRSQVTHAGEGAVELAMDILGPLGSSQVPRSLKPRSHLQSPSDSSAGTDSCLLDRSQVMGAGEGALELAMDVLDPLGVSQDLDACVGMPQLDSGVNGSYAYTLNFMDLPMGQPDLGSIDMPDGERSNRCFRGEK